MPHGLKLGNGAISLNNSKDR